VTDLIAAMGVLAIILTLAALASGIVERAPLSFPMIFLALGFLVGPLGLNWLQIDAHSRMLEVVATVSLALVLFLDAVNLQVDELRRDWYVPVLTLGPGTLLIIAGVAVVAWRIVGTAPIESLLLGAILASTDPVVLRDVVRDSRIPRSVRRALSVEAGTNDLVVLPIVLILIAVLRENVGSPGEWALFLGQLLILSPLVGLAVGGGGAWLMGKADAAFGIRREYQALYGIGLVLAAFAAGTVVRGDGFLAAFFAGLAITLFNVSLCDCFLDYGEVTAEMMMLLAFVLFGAVLSTLLGTIPLAAALALAVIALVAIRPGALYLVLMRARMSNAARLFLGWFGPRGLNSLLLALLAVQAGVPNAEWLLALAGAVVVVSVIVHGASATPLASFYARRVSAPGPALAEERESTFVGLFEDDPNDVARLSPEELQNLFASETPPVVLDVRSRAQYDQDDGQIPGSVRVPPDRVEEWIAAAAPDRLVVTYCT
jgi:NhaP-type Na+/H+ or K+/H+ antiporter